MTLWKEISGQLERIARNQRENEAFLANADADADLRRLHMMLDCVLEEIDRIKGFVPTPPRPRRLMGKRKPSQ